MENKKIIAIIEDKNNNIVAVYEDGKKEVKSVDGLKNCVDGLSEELKAEAAAIIRRAEKAGENWQHCKHIADELDAIANGRKYKCLKCGEVFDIEDAEEIPQADGSIVYRCPECGELIEEDEAEQETIFDYMDEVFDINFTVSSENEYIATCICVAWGGPSIYIDTNEKAVCLYWWGSKEKVYLTDEATKAVDDWAEEYFYSCVKCK